MRGIKFRVWDGVELKFHASHKKKFALRSDGSLLLTDGGSADRYHIPQFFTGWTDIHGTEIYEGDIVKYTSGDHTFIEKVSFVGGSWQTQSKTGMFSVHLGFHDYEVVGNIMENLDLLPNEQV
jgi:uncharacterized phage protein (TIGR01671 family)